jgi:hypothetical protein
MELDIQDYVAALNYQQLLRLEFDLAHGGIGIKRMVDARIKELETSSKKCCATCGTDVATENSSYTLVFGPSDLRKKATCCGMDCFEQFIAKLKQFEGKSVSVMEK